MTIDVGALLAANRAAYESGGAPLHLNTQVLTEDDLPEPCEGRFKRIAVLSDYHIRTYKERVWDTRGEYYKWHEVTAHDPLAMKVVERFLEDWKPDSIIYNGDMIDCHQISRFCKSPRDMDGLQEDLDLLQALFDSHAKKWPKAERHYLLGNHEARLQMYINGNAPALGGLRALSDYAIFGAKQGNMRVYPYPVRVPIIPGVLDVCHGDKVAQKSGATAQKMLEQGVSGVSGHVHRLGMVYKTTRTGTTVWAEGGCLCNLNPEYVQSPNWQQGITLLYVDEARRNFHMDQVPVHTQGRLIYGGQVYEANVVR